MTTKNRIYQVGTELFRDKGFAATSMQDIAKGAGIKPASIYNHFVSKQSILNDLLMKGAEMFVEGMKDIKNSSLRSIEKLEKLIGLHVRISVEHTHLMSLMATEWRHLEGEVRLNYIRMRDSYEDDFKATLLAAMEEGDISEIDVDIALFSILTTLKWFYSWYDKHSDLSPFDLEKHMITCLLGGIRD